jgi:hypothetical protein
MTTAATSGRGPSSVTDLRAARESRANEVICGVVHTYSIR